MQWYLFAGSNLSNRESTLALGMHGRDLSPECWWENKGELCLPMHSWQILQLHEVCGLAAALCPLTPAPHFVSQVRCPWKKPWAPRSPPWSSPTAGAHVGSWLTLGQPSKTWWSHLLEILLPFNHAGWRTAPCHSRDVEEQKLNVCSDFFI